MPKVAKTRATQAKVTRAPAASVTTEPTISHLNAAGEMHMVDIGEKAVTERIATASATLTLDAGTAKLLRDNRLPKGDVWAAIRLAGVQGAKRTADLIPLCHPLALSHVHIDVTLTHSTLLIVATVKTTGKTGVEMEALTAASVAALTAYDMLKAVQKDIPVHLALESKAGGRSGEWVRTERAPRKRER
jgi:cyclic pyranopterin monophosphate synthase